MDKYTGYVYAAMWLIIAIYLFYIAFKESKFFFVLSAFFLFLSGWYLSNELLTNINLFEGYYAWIYKGVSIVVLILCAIAYIRYKKRLSTTQNTDNNE